MDAIKLYSRRSFIILLLFMVILFLMINVLFYYGINMVISKIPLALSAETDLNVINDFLNWLSLNLNNIAFYVIPGSAFLMVLWSVIIWSVLKKSLVEIINSFYPEKVKNSVRQNIESKKEKQDHDRKVFLHLLSVLQREGRLIDFFAEDLSLYEDDQIGAAVRSIHDNCFKTINKYLALKSVIDMEEGDEVTVDESFDPETIKLIGNVTGNPPFKGVLRHKGWKADKTDMPSFLKVHNPSIIAPAEVEI